MYEVTNDVINLFKNNYRQVARLTITLVNGTVLNLTEANIVQGGLSIDRYCVPGSCIELGTAISSELNLVLDNWNGEYDAVDFEGANILVEIGIKKWDALPEENAVITYIPCGYFIVDESSRKLKNITLSALDYMVKFDKKVMFTSEPRSIRYLLENASLMCGVRLGFSPSYLVNNDYTSIRRYPDGYRDWTYREVIQWIAQITGTCAFITQQGYLVLAKYGSNITTLNITPSDRYESVLQEQDIVITGVSFTDLKNNEYHSGTLNYPIKLDGNMLLQHEYQTRLDNIWNNCVNDIIEYRPFTATCKPMPFLYPLDKVNFVDSNNNIHSSLITHVHFTMNLNTKIKSVGDTNVKHSYSSEKPLTPNSERVINKLKVEIDEVDDLSKNFNDTINNSIGLNKTIYDSKYYYHDGTTLVNSTIIYTFGTNGFAWTNNWNEGNPTWNYGVDRSGNALLNLLKVYKITAEQIQVTDLSALQATIGGWTIENDSIVNGNMKLYGGSTSVLDWQVDSLINTGKSTCRIMAGGNNPSDAKFLVLEDGSVYAQAADIQGKITGSAITGSSISGGEINIGYNNLFKVHIHNGLTRICGPIYAAYSGMATYPYPVTIPLFVFSFQSQDIYLCAYKEENTPWSITFRGTLDGLGEPHSYLEGFL